MKPSVLKYVAVLFPTLAFMFFLASGIQTDRVTFVSVGVVALVFSLIAWLACFRSLFDAKRFGWLQMGLAIMFVHGSCIAAEVAMRTIEARQAERLSELERRFIRSHATAWQEFQAVLQPHPVYGVVPIPNTSILRGENLHQFNSHGTLGREFSFEKQPGELRILCLGASTTFGEATLPNEKPWPEVLEGILIKELSRPVTVINSAIPGIVAQCHSARFENELWKFQPDAVIFYEAFANLPTGIRGDARFKRRGSVLLERLMRSSAKYVSNNAQYTPNHRQWYKYALEQIGRVAKEHGIKPFFGTFALAYNEQSPPVVLEFHARVLPQIGSGSLFFVLDCVRINNVLLRNVAKQYGATIVDIDKRLGGQNDYFSDFCHFTQEGRDIVAREMADAIIEWVHGLQIEE